MRRVRSCPDLAGVAAPLVTAPLAAPPVPVVTPMRAGRPSASKMRKSHSAQAFPPFALDSMIPAELVVSPISTISECHVLYGFPRDLMNESSEQQRAFASCLATVDAPHVEGTPRSAAAFLEEESHPRWTFMQKLEEDAAFQNRYVEWCRRIHDRRRRLKAAEKTS